MAKKSTFKNGSFVIALANGEALTVEGKVSSDGRWGIHFSPLRGWIVTHIGCGFTAGPPFHKQFHAIRYAKTLASRPDLMTGGEFGVTPGWATQPSAELQDLIRSARRAVEEGRP